MIHLRPERSEDAAAIREVHRRAFGGDAEAGIVDAVRTAGAAVLSMVAMEGPGPEDPGTDAALEGAAPPDLGTGAAGQVVAHILYSRATVAAEDGGQISLLGLAPVAVLPSHQNRGVGTLLIEASLEHLRADGHSGVVVVGHPDYYPRFGFLPGSPWGLRWETEAPDGVFMAAELSPGSLAGVHGVARFRPEFGGV
jgi:putative acetyltransferase